MRRARRKLLAALAAAALAAGVATTVEAIPAEATELAPAIKLRVLDEDAWHPDNDFRVSWDATYAGGLEFALGGIHYRLRDANGNVVGVEGRLSGGVDAIDHLHVPPVPGRYTIDVGFENGNRETVALSSAALRFDDARPGPARPLMPGAWIGANTAAIVRLEHPAPPLPVSGIRGYAVSVDNGSGDSPCAAADRCSDAESDLRGGIDDDTLSLGILPEGVNVVRAVAVSGSGMKSAEAMSATVHVDATRPAVGLRGMPAGWASGPVEMTATASDLLSGMAPAGPNGPLTSIAIDDGVPKSAAGSTVATTVIGSGTHRVTAFARDAAGNISGDGPRFPPALAVVRIDENAPSVAFARAQDPSEPERIEAVVTDSLSGPDPGRGSIAVRAAGTRRRFVPLPTTASAGRLVARWESEAFAAGAYEFRATGYDAAGNSGESDRRANGARMVLSNPLKTPTAIQAGFGGKRLTWHRCTGPAGRRRCRREVINGFAHRPATRLVPYGRGLPFSGRLASASGSPLAGMPVQVIENFDAGANPSQRVTTVETAADGTFIARLLPGPSRQVEATFAGNRVLTHAAGPQLRLAVLDGIRMHASAASARVGGAPVVFAGRLAGDGASAPSEGRPVELQFRLPGSDWSEFRTVQTDARGRFRYAYSFSDDDSRGVRFQFRAYAPTQDGWPYEAAASRPLFVTGR